MRSGSGVMSLRLADESLALISFSIHPRLYSVAARTLKCHVMILMIYIEERPILSWPPLEYYRHILLRIILRYDLTTD